MRILHVITTLDVGGAERLMVDLLPLLRNKGFDVELMLFDGVETALKDEFSKTGIKIHELSRGHQLRNYKKIYNPYNIIRLTKFLKGYDIIHTHNTACQYYVPIAAKVASAHLKLVTTEHSSNNRRRKSCWLKPIDKWMYGQYDAIICISDQTRVNLENYIGFSNRVFTINNGVNTSRFQRQIKDISNNSQYIITMVAGLRMEKDHKTLFKAMLNLPANYRLQLVGHGERETELKAFCDKNDLNSRVSFMGLRMDVPDVLEESDIIVLSSHWEGLSLSSIEGMASGRPFIASDVDGLHEIVKGAGLLFPQGDDKALAEAIRSLCENPEYYHRVAMACQSRAKEYDISVMADKYADLYESLIVE